MLLKKRGLQELPEDAQSKGTAVSVFEFNVLDEETGEDVGEQGFEEPVELTLHYTDEEIPVGVQEKNLTVGTFNEATLDWEVMPEQSIVSFNAERKHVRRLSLKDHGSKNHGHGTRETIRKSAKLYVYVIEQKRSILAGRGKGLWPE